MKQMVPVVRLSRFNKDDFCINLGTGYLWQITEHDAEILNEGWDNGKRNVVKLEGDPSRTPNVVFTTDEDLDPYIKFMYKLLYEDNWNGVWPYKEYKKLRQLGKELEDNINKSLFYGTKRNN